MKKKFNELTALHKIVKASKKAGADVRMKPVHVRQDGTTEYRLFIDFEQTAVNIWTDDTFDWAERLAIEELCQEHKVNGIEGFGYGKGWQYEAEKISLSGALRLPACR